ncbi:MAG: DUF3805 domain-containing protein [Bacteroides sp.]|nr:DUF3805 domain-containing protein [Bacteroides sp.]
MIQGKKFVSPGAWFSMIYPSGWNEFEDTESSFLFYNPNQWTGNFRISAYKEKGANASTFGKKFMQAELKENDTASLIRISKLECAYSKEMFEEEGEYYVNHRWITGIENVGFECTFTTIRGGKTVEAETIIQSLEIRKENQKYPPEIIPVRILEISIINESFEWVTSIVKKQLKKDFQGVEEDLNKPQHIMESGQFTPKQKEAWIAFGIAVCVILSNEVEGMEWMTLIDGNREAPVLVYQSTQQIIDPMSLVWSKLKRGQHCDILDEYKQIIENL